MKYIFSLLLSFIFCNAFAFPKPKGQVRPDYPPTAGEPLSLLTIVIVLVILVAFVLILQRVLNKQIQKSDNSALETDDEESDDYDYYLKINVLEDIEDEISVYYLEQLQTKRRANGFLIYGIITSILGVLIFAILIFLPINFFFDNVIDSELAVFLSRLSVLIFIESIAFYLFKQYRISMDDYKYFDSLKRQLVANKILFKIKHQYPEAYTDLKADLKLFDNPDRLQTGETTVSLKHRKLTQSDDAFINRIVEEVVKKI